MGDIIQTSLGMSVWSCSYNITICKRCSHQAKIYWAKFKPERHNCSLSITHVAICSKIDNPRWVLLRANFLMGANPFPPIMGVWSRKRRSCLVGLYSAVLKPNFRPASSRINTKKVRASWSEDNLSPSSINIPVSWAWACLQIDFR